MSVGKITPIGSSGGGGGGGVTSVVAGTGISVDNTDPANPIVTSLADRYKTTSTTSQAIVPTGTLTFTVDSGLSYTSQQDIMIVHNASNHMHGQVVSYSGTTLVVDITHKTGSGTYTSWVINLDGLPVGGGTPGGANGSIQYNNSGSFDGLGTYNNTTGKLSLGMQYTYLGEAIASGYQYITISSYEVDMYVETSTVYLDTTVDSEITGITPYDTSGQHLWLYNKSANVIRLNHMDVGSGSSYLIELDSGAFKDLYPNEGIHLIYNPSTGYWNNVGKSNAGGKAKKITVNIVGPCKEYKTTISDSDVLETSCIIIGHGSYIYNDQNEDEAEVIKSIEPRNVGDGSFDIRIAANQYIVGPFKFIYYIL